MNSLLLHRGWVGRGGGSGSSECIFLPCLGYGEAAAAGGVAGTAAAQEQTPPSCGCTAAQALWTRPLRGQDTPKAGPPAPPSQQKQSAVCQLPKHSFQTFEVHSKHAHQSTLAQFMWGSTAGWPQSWQPIAAGSWSAGVSASVEWFGKRMVNHE